MEVVSGSKTLTELSAMASERAKIRRERAKELLRTEELQGLAFDIKRAIATASAEGRLITGTTGNCHSVGQPVRGCAIGQAMRVCLEEYRMRPNEIEGRNEKLSANTIFGLLYEAGLMTANDSNGLEGDCRRHSRVNPDALPVLLKIVDKALNLEEE